MPRFSIRSRSPSRRLGAAAIIVPPLTLASVSAVALATAFLINPMASFALSLALYPIALLICASTSILSIVMCGRGDSGLFRVGTAVGLTIFLLLIASGVFWISMLGSALKSDG